MNKTEVYRWRLDPGLKQRLEHAARAEKISVGGLLDRLVREWLAKRKADEEALHTRERIRAHVRAPRVDKHRRWRRDAPAGSD